MRSLQRRGWPQRVCVHLVWREAVVLVGVVVVATAIWSRSGHTPGSRLPNDMYVSDAPEGQQLLPLAEATLADRSDAQVVSLDAPAWAASADGSTLASLVYTRDPGRPADDVTVVVRDARTGNERSRFQAPMDVVGPVLNRDGTLLVAVSRDEPTEWWALETATGAVRGHVELSGSGWHTYTIDPEAHRLYLLESDLPIEPLPNQPRSVALSVRDLGTGGEIARVELPDVLAGPWLSARLIDGA